MAKKRTAGDKKRLEQFSRQVKLAQRKTAKKGARAGARKGVRAGLGLGVGTRRRKR